MGGNTYKVGWLGGLRNAVSADKVGVTRHTLYVLFLLGAFQ